MSETTKPKPGDQLRDDAAFYLASRFGTPTTEYREDGKKVDVFFEHMNLGKRERLYIEAKDYNRELRRNDVNLIWADYMGIVERNQPADLLLVTREGLTPDAKKYISEHARIRHQTITEIEFGSVDLSTYLLSLSKSTEYEEISDYYIEAGFSLRNIPSTFSSELKSATRDEFPVGESALAALRAWVSNSSSNFPIAVLGGYGSGKTSLATMLTAQLAQEAIEDPEKRQPVLIRLGGISRHSAIEGLIGSLFTSEHPVRNFSFPNFMSLTKKGRYVFVLDGFDEMKHAMSWVDFASQVETLLKLHSPNSKIVMLGRPSALLTEDEDRYILKGQRRVEQNWVNLPNWPAFVEIQLSDFTDREREKFISQYLAHRARIDGQLGRVMNEEQALKRSEDVSQIAKDHQDLLSKPVHSKLLTDLAADPNFDLNQFKQGFSRWSLYREFISTLYVRENRKEARRPVTPSARIEFLRELSFWLWTNKRTLTTFTVDEIPHYLFEKYEEVEGYDLDDIRREMLTGSILEKKGEEIFYFGHRSFAEFLVSDRMLNIPPAASDHQHYSDALRDGVKLFLEEADFPQNSLEWVNTFSISRGRISLTYLEYLGEMTGGISQLRANLTDGSFWSVVLTPFADKIVWNEAVNKRVLDLLDTSKPEVFAWLYCWLTSNEEEVGFRDKSSAYFEGAIYSFDLVLLRCLLTALFSKVSGEGRSLNVGSEFVGHRKILDRAVQIIGDDDGEIEFSFDRRELFDACVAELERTGYAWSGATLNSNRSERVTLQQVIRGMGHPSRGRLEVFAKHVQNWSRIVEVGKGKLSQQQRRRPQSNRRRS